MGQVLVLVVNLSFTADCAITSSCSTGTTTSSDFVGHATGHGDGFDCGDKGCRTRLVMVLVTAVTTLQLLMIMMLLLMVVMMNTKRRMVKVMVRKAEDNDLMIRRWLVVMVTSAVMARSIAITQ